MLSSTLRFVSECMFSNLIFYFVPTETHDVSNNWPTQMLECTSVPLLTRSMLHQVNRKRIHLKF
jgi:hypothetical protein